MKLEKYFYLTLKKTALVIIAFVAAVILHNAVYAIFNFEEAFFFIIAVIILPAYLAISAVYSICHSIRLRNKYVKKSKKK